VRLLALASSISTDYLLADHQTSMIKNTTVYSDDDVELIALLDHLIN